MPDLGKYADAVLGAYAVSIALVIGIVALTLWRSGRVTAELDALEKDSADRP